MSKPVALGYTRLSQTSDTSIDDQQKEIKELADAESFYLKHIYNDGERSSGFDSHRSEYVQMLTHVEEGNIDALIVRDTDRIARDKAERLRLMLDAEEYGIEIWTTVDGRAVNLEDDEGFLLEFLSAYFDDVFKRREIDKSKKKTQERIKNGYYHGRPPLGLQFNDAKTALEPDPREFQTALDVFGLRDEGHSYRYIVEETGVSRGTVSRLLERKEDIYNPLRKDFENKHQKDEYH